MKSFPHYLQLDAMDCGAACLRMAAKYYGREYTLQTLREKTYITREGVSLRGIADAAESIGIRTKGLKIDFEKLATQAPLPLIAHWQQNHFVVVYNIKKTRKGWKVYVADPGSGKIILTEKEFKQGWISTREQNMEKGICLLMVPTPEFYETEDEKGKNRTRIGYLINYLRPYRGLMFQLLLGMLVGSLIQLVFPFLTQAIVDVGINNRNINFIYLILAGQLFFIFSRSSVDFIRRWILLHISTRINVSLISDFLMKLMKLPIGFFDTKMIGDILQRIQDHRRIEHFLTSATLQILFAIVNIVIFSIVLAIYNYQILLLFLAGSILYVLWINIFLKKRKEVDHRNFMQLSMNQNMLVQLITGMQEIKMNNCEKEKRWEWEKIQAKIFRIKIRGLQIDQYQSLGGIFLMESTNILLTFLTAKLVIEGQITIGMMLAVQYIIGQLSAPVNRLIDFQHSLQDAQISMERLGEIHLKEDEEEEENMRIAQLPENKTIEIKSLYFQYEGPHSEMVLKDINLCIPEGKTTAIVGASGSGKTTLLKLMLGFYPPVKGNVYVGDFPLDGYSKHMWREHCGAVLQDGFIFSDTIAKNIAVSDRIVDKEKLLYAVKAANIAEFISSLPLRFNTKIGADGHGLSQGQKQRILIARAIYKNPPYLFFDEATNALDTENEKAIMNNMKEFYRNRTVVVVAHRLSTVRDADRIIAIDKGKIIETGTHESLIKNRKVYYNLVKNQLELQARVTDG